MIVGFVIWTLTALCVAAVGVWSWRAKEPAGFFAGVRPPRVRDTRAYNRAVGILWFVYAALLEALGLPLLFLRQNSAGFLLSILGTVLISIGLTIAYHFILKKHRAE